MVSSIASAMMRSRRSLVHCSAVLLSRSSISTAAQPASASSLTGLGATSARRSRADGLRIFWRTCKLGPGGARGRRAVVVVVLTAAIVGALEAERGTRLSPAEDMAAATASSSEDDDTPCQEAPHTALNHYPEIFKRALSRSSGAVLSFGCSTGEEVRSLKALTTRPVHGVEIDKQRLAQARSSDPGGCSQDYARKPEAFAPASHGLIFAMSVLCRYPSENPTADFPFSTFCAWLARLDRLLEPGGLLILWNANYDFRETPLFETGDYAVEPDFDLADRGRGFDSECPQGLPGSGFLPKFSKTHKPKGDEASRSTPLAYRKSRKEHR